MSIATIRRHPALLGVALIFACTWPIDLALAAQSRSLLPFYVPPILGLFLGYGVVAGSLIAAALAGGRRSVSTLLRRFVIWRVGIGWYAVALFGVPVVYLVALALAVALGGPAPDFGRPYVTRFVPAGLALWIIVPGWLLYEIFTNGEEIGWRGYLLPRIEVHHGALVATMLVATVWALWHLPKFLVIPTGYDYPLWLWAADLFAKAVLLSWLFHHTGGSLLLVTLFHASYNTAALTLPILPASYGDVSAFATGVVLLVVVAVGVVVLDRGATGTPVPQRDGRVAVS